MAEVEESQGAGGKLCGVTHVKASVASRVLGGGVSIPTTIRHTKDLAARKGQLRTT